MARLPRLTRRISAREKAFPLGNDAVSELPDGLTRCGSVQSLDVLALSRALCACGLAWLPEFPEEQ